jgi:hypothetical protein
MRKSILFELDKSCREDSASDIAKKCSELSNHRIDKLGVELISSVLVVLTCLRNDEIEGFDWCKTISHLTMEGIITLIQREDVLFTDSLSLIEYLEHISIGEVEDFSTVGAVLHSSEPLLFSKEFISITSKHNLVLKKLLNCFD